MRTTFHLRCLHAALFGVPALVLVLLLLIFVPAYGQEVTYSAEGSISGQVVGPPQGSESRYRSVAVFAQKGGAWRRVKLADVDQFTLRYLAAGLDPGTYRLCLAADWITGRDGPCYDRIAGGVAVATDVELGAGAVITDIDIAQNEFVDGGSIRGTVTDEKGQGLEGLTVAVNERAGGGYDLVTLAYTQTDAAGAYRFDNLLQGLYTVAVWDLNGRYLPGQYGSNDAEYMDMAVQPLETREGVDFQLSPGGEITGALSLGGAPPSDGLVSATAVDSGQQTTGLYDPASGQYAIKPLAPGAYFVHASADNPLVESYLNLEGDYLGSAPTGSAVAVTVTAGSTVGGINISLGDDFFSKVSGTVTSTDGKPLGGIRVELLPQTLFISQAPTYTVTTEDGSYRFDGLYAGNFKLRFSDSEGVYATIYAPAEYTAAKATVYGLGTGQLAETIDVRMPPAGQVQGRVLRADLSPIDGARVALLLSRETLLETTADASGQYSSGPLPPGQYQVCAFASVPLLPDLYCRGFELRVPYPGLAVTVRAGETTTDVDLVYGAEAHFSDWIFVPGMAQEPGGQ